MNELSIFKHEMFGQIRTTRIEGQIYFIAKDICEFFGDADHKRSVSRLDGDDKLLVDVLDSLGRNQKATAVNESGLYALLFNFQPEMSRKDGGAQNTPRIEERIKTIKAF